MTGFNAFHIGLRTFGTKIVPRVENVHPSVHGSLGDYPIEPDALHFLVAEERKQLVDVVNVEINKYVLNKCLVGNGSHLRQVVRPKAILSFQPTKQISSDIIVHNLEAKIGIFLETAKQIGKNKQKSNKTPTGEQNLL